jgi:AmmeMemoRadiSam system protein A
MTSGGTHNPDLPENHHQWASPGLSQPLRSSPPPATGHLTQILSPNQRQCLLELARSTILAAVHQKPIIAPPTTQLDPRLLEKRACFVTLEKNCTLRGCIGHLIPLGPLHSNIIETSQQAALADPRFARVRPEELDEITIEISILSDLIPLNYESADGLLAQLRPGLGVALHLEDRTSTFLPRVWDQIPDKADFLDRLALKGGWEPSSWRTPRARVSIYDVESFREETGLH